MFSDLSRPFLANATTPQVLFGIDLECPDQLLPGTEMDRAFGVLSSLENGTLVRYPPLPSSAVLIDAVERASWQHFIAHLPPQGRYEGGPISSTEAVLSTISESSDSIQSDLPLMSHFPFRSEFENEELQCLQERIYEQLLEDGPTSASAIFEQYNIYLSPTTGTWELVNQALIQLRAAGRCKWVAGPDQEEGCWAAVHRDPPDPLESLYRFYENNWGVFSRGPFKYEESREEEHKSMSSGAELGPRRRIPIERL